MSIPSFVSVPQNGGPASWNFSTYRPLEINYNQLQAQLQPQQQQQIYPGGYQSGSWTSSYLSNSDPPMVDINVNPTTTDSSSSGAGGETPTTALVVSNPPTFWGMSVAFWVGLILSVIGFIALFVGIYYLERGRNATTPKVSTASVAPTNQ